MTRRLVVTQNVTLDGVVEATGGWFAPAGTDDAESAATMLEVQERHRASSDAFLCGRVTFVELRGFWRDLTDDRTGVADHLDRVTKHVVSRTLGDPAWRNTDVLRGDPVTEVAALKERDGADIVLTGSIELLHTLQPAGLVDEYRLFVYPVALGQGRRLFPGPESVQGLDLIDSCDLGNGIVLLTYATG